MRVRVWQLPSLKSESLPLNMTMSEDVEEGAPCWNKGKDEVRGTMNRFESFCLTCVLATDINPPAERDPHTSF